MHTQRDGDMEEQTMTSDFWSVEIVYGQGEWRGGVEDNGVARRLKGGHRPNANTAFRAKEPRQFRITGRF